MNGFPAQLINSATLQLVRFSFHPFKTYAGKKQEEPLLVSGIYRSGTSITTNILSHAGFDAGPHNHLLQPTAINPDGFFENYFFMDLSRYLFFLLHANGDAPPAEEDTGNIEVLQLRDDDFRKYTLLEIHDDRVRNINKLRVLRRASVHHMREYISHAFGTKPLIKNPHFSVLEPFFTKIFPGSHRVVVFRDPQEWMRSAQVVSKNSDMALYDKYYAYYLRHEHAAHLYFDYDHLLADPVYSIGKLLDRLQITNASPSELAKLVRSNAKPGAKKNKGSDTSLAYPKLLKLAVNP